MILLSHMGQSRLGTRRYVRVTSHMGQSFTGTKQDILLLTMTRKIWTEVSLDKTSH